LQSVPFTPHWDAQLSLDFQRRDQRTIIARRQHHGPLVIQKPFYPEGATCHIYLLHPPGGLVGGDCLTLDINLQSDTHTLITTPGAAKFYRSAGAPATQSQNFTVANHALLEWLPQESIAFDNTNAYVHTTVNLDIHAKFIGWEVTCLGRQASGEQFNSGQFVQKLEVYFDNKPVLIERALFKGNGELLSADWGLANHSVVGTMIVAPANQQIIKTIREQVQPGSHELFSVTLMDNVLVCRYLGPQAETAKHLFIKVWKIVRPFVQNVESCIPRIWNT